MLCNFSIIMWGEEVGGGGGGAGCVATEIIENNLLRTFLRTWFITYFCFAGK